MVKKRVWLKNSYLHITIRGNRRNDIFRDEADLGFFREILKQNLKRYSDLDIYIATYCLMTNHVHLLVKTGENHPGIFMGTLISVYTKYFNKKYNYIGRLLQDRYHSEIIDNDAYLLETSRYIHLNPYRAKMVEHPKEYKWSSYDELTSVMDEKIVREECILNYFKYRSRYKLYEKFIEDKINSKCEEVENGISS